MGKIYLEGADNTRDLGGLKTTEGAAVSYTHLDVYKRQGPYFDIMEPA